MAKAKRGNGEGSIYKRADGYWVAAISRGADDSGKQLPKKTLYGKTRAEVAAKLVEVQAAQAEGTLSTTRQSVTVGQLLQAWLDEVVKPTCRPKTYLSYEQMVRTHLAPALGRVRLSDLDARQIQAFLKRKSESGLSVRTVSYLRAVLRQGVQQGMKWGWVSRNVVALTDPPRATGEAALRPSRAVAVAAAFDAGLVPKLLAALEGHRHANLFRVQLALALRLGEVLGLKVSDIQFDQAGQPVAVKISTQLQALPSGFAISPPKSEAGNRPIPLPRMAREAIAAQLLKLETIRAEVAQIGLEGNAALAEDWGLLFRTGTGTPFHERNVRRDFANLLARAEIAPLRTHDLRHLCVTLLLSQGVPMDVVKKIVGHSTIGVTIDTYGHVMPHVLQAAADSLDEVL